LHIRQTGTRYDGLRQACTYGDYRCHQSAPVHGRAQTGSGCSYQARRLNASMFIRADVQILDEVVTAVKVNEHQTLI